MTATLRGGTIRRAAAVTIDTGHSSLDIYPGDNIQARVTTMPAGTAFRLHAGVHRLQSITPRDGDTFTGEAGAILSRRPAC